MRRSYILGLIVAMAIFMLLISGYSTQENTDAEWSKVPASAARTPEYLVSHMIRYRGDTLDSEWFYNYTDGLLTEVTCISERSNPVKWTIEYTYDEEGRKTREVNTMYSELGDVSWPLFDIQGNMMEIVGDPDNNQKTLIEVETIEYEYPEGSTSVLAYKVGADGSKTLDHEDYYDAWGHLIGRSDHGYTQMAYDRYGTEIGEIRMGRSIDSEYVRSVPNVNTFYDLGGNLSQFSGYSESEGFTIHQLSYDDLGRIIRNVAWYAIRLELDQLTIYDHTWTYNSDGSYVQVTHTYDAVSPETSQGDETLVTIEYSPSHIPTRQTIADAQSGELFQEIVYDAEGDPESWLIFGNGEPSAFIRYEKNRDENGNVLESRKYSGDLLTERIEFEYVYQ